MGSSPNAISQLSGLFGQGTPQSGAVPGSGMEMPNMGSNQYMQYPNTPGIVPTQGTLPGGTSPYGSNTGAYYATGGDVPGTNTIHMQPTMDPTLTQQYYNMLSQQVGQGLPGFNLSTLLPSSGQATQPGQLNAPLNLTDQQLQAFLTGGPSNIPGASQLTQMAQTGNPIDQTPAWQAMIASEAQNTAQNANNLREQFAFGGDLKSSPFGTAMQQFYNQNTLNQNAQLTQAQAQAMESAQNRALSAQQGIQSEAGQFGQQAQTMDQQAIDQMLKEFYISLPQNNPLLQNIQQGANMQPGVAGQTPTFGQSANQLITALGSLF